MNTATHQTQKPTRFEVAQKSATTRRKNTEERNRRIRERANNLYNVERRRFDDVLSLLAEHFGLSCETIRRVLKKKEKKQLEYA